jgi:polygalacturonase
MNIEKNFVVCCLAALLAACGEGAVATVSAPEAPFPMPEIPVWVSTGRDFPLNDFGGDFNKAIEAAAAVGGGRVVVPAGEWPTGAISLKSNVELHLEKDAKVVFSDDPKDYLPAVHTSWEGVELLNYSPLVYAYGCTNVAITGGGTFAPKMDLWRKWFARPPEHMAFTAKLYDWCSRVAPLSERDAIKLPGSNARPHLLQFNRCRNVNLDGFRIRESPFWTIHLYHSENAVVRNLDVSAHGHNNDGVDVEMTKNVIVEKCRFDQGDDAVVIKAGRNQDAWALNCPSENIVIRNCVIADGHVLLGIGSELSGGVRNVYMHDCRMSGNVRGVFFVKTNERRGGFVENIYMKDCSVEMSDKYTPFSAVGVETDVLYQWRNLPTHEVKVTRIRNIVAENVHAGRVRHLLGIYGDKRDPIDGVTLKNVKCGKVLEEPVVVINAKNVTVDGKEIPSAEGVSPKR